MAVALVEVAALAVVNVDVGGALEVLMLCASRHALTKRLLVILSYPVLDGMGWVAVVGVRFHAVAATVKLAK